MCFQEVIEEAQTNEQVTGSGTEDFCYPSRLKLPTLPEAEWISILVMKFTKQYSGIVQNLFQDDAW